MADTLKSFMSFCSPEATQDEPPPGANDVTMTDVPEPEPCPPDHCTAFDNDEDGSHTAKWEKINTEDGADYHQLWKRHLAAVNDRDNIKHEKARLQKYNNSLEKQLSTTAGHLDSTKEALARAEVECSSLRSDVDALLEERNEIERVLLQLQDEHHKLRKNYAIISGERDEIQQLCCEWQTYADQLKRQRPYKALKVCEKENKSLRQRLDRLVREEQSLRVELEQSRNSLRKSREEALRSQEEAREATKKSTNLYQMLEMQVTKRKSQGHGEFPNGEKIEALIRCNQDYMDDFFRDLADILPQELKLSAKCDHETVLDNVLVPVSLHTIGRAEDFVASKRKHLVGLVGDAQRKEGARLVSLLWMSSMQGHVVRRIRGAQEQPVETASDDWPCALRWASQDEVKSLPDMEGRTIGELSVGLSNAWLLCKFSEPECFLHPKIGDEVEYNPALHEIKHLPGVNRRVPQGAICRVIYPGLYFAHPETKEKNRPISPAVKAIVVCFQCEL